MSLNNVFRFEISKLVTLRCTSKSHIMQPVYCFNVTHAGYRMFFDAADDTGIIYRQNTVRLRRCRF